MVVNQLKVRPLSNLWFSDVNLHPYNLTNVAKILGDNVTADELEQLMNLGEADVNDDGEIDREEFGFIMNCQKVGAGARGAASIPSTSCLRRVDSRSHEGV